MTKTDDRLDEHQKQLDAHQEKLDSITVLSPWEIKVIRWTSRAIMGLITLLGLAIALSSLKEFWDHFIGD